MERVPGSSLEEEQRQVDIYCGAEGVPPFLDLAAIIIIAFCYGQCAQMAAHHADTVRLLWAFKERPLVLVCLWVQVPILFFGWGYYHCRAGYRAALPSLVNIALFLRPLYLG